MGILELEPLGLFGRPHARSERIARIERSVQHTAPLHSLGRTHGPFGKEDLLTVAVIGRVGINDAANGAVLRGKLRLDASPRFSIAGNDDGSFDGDAVTSKLLVVGNQAVVHIDQRRGHVPVGRVGVVRG